MLGGLPVIYGINPLTYEVAPSHPLGSIGYTPDGRKFRYARNNATNAMVAGTLQQARVEDTGDQSLTVAATAIGATTITTVGTVTVTANQYANGYVVTTGEGGTGNGYVYRIKSHPAATSAVVTLTLYDPIVVALSTATQIDIVPNPYDGVLINPTTATSAPVGVAMNVCPADYYTWIQTGGAGLLYADASGACTVGASLTASNQTAGCVEDGDTDTQAIVGVALTGIAQAEFGLANLTID
jgi:hypothetical protein